MEKKRLTSAGVICGLAKTRNQENYLYAVQSKAFLDIDLNLIEKVDDTDLEKRFLAEIKLKLTEDPEQFVRHKQAVQQGIYSLREKIQRLYLMSDRVQQYDLKTYRSSVLEIENLISDIHNNNQLRIAELKFNYMNIVAELPEPSDLLKEETKFKPSRPAAINARMKKNCVQDEPNSSKACDGGGNYKEVNDFDRFLLSHGGHSGGWIEEQHSIYMGLKAKYRNNRPRIVDAFKGILPGNIKKIWI